jgi:hypothetical protein
MISNKLLSLLTMSDSEGLPKTLSDIQLTERHRSSSASVESLGLYRSRSPTLDRNRVSSVNSCCPVLEETNDERASSTAEAEPAAAQEGASTS